MKHDFLDPLKKNGIFALAHLEKSDQAQIADWAQHMVDLYREVLRNKSHKVSTINELPCAKEELKLALKVLLPASIANADDDTVERLREAYIRLSGFQEIRREDLSPLSEAASKTDDGPASTDSGLFPMYHRYLQLVLLEEKILLEEINVYIDDVRHKIL